MLDLVSVWAEVTVCVGKFLDSEKMREYGQKPRGEAGRFAHDGNVHTRAAAGE
jgi:hypothetical protein